MTDRALADDQKLHTPAPWFVGAQNDALYVIVGEAPSINNDYPRHDANREPVAKVYTSDADARLIAAAPELLEIVRELCSYAGGMEYDTYRGFVQRADAVLARAEGRSNG